MKKLRFKEFSQERPKPSGLDLTCKLQHFALITYAVSPAVFSGIIPRRLQPDTVVIDGEEKCLVSVVPFLAVDFTSAVYPFPKLTMGQVNYRTYVTDTVTGERCVWFLGATLDSWTVIVPRYLWKLPWHRGRIRFDCHFDEGAGRYERYAVTSEAAAAPARVVLGRSSRESLALPGFTDTETGLVFLTHRMRGCYRRRDGRLGSFRVWHRKLEVKPATLVQASFGFLAGLGLVDESGQLYPHSVLVEPLNEFTIYLPPGIIR